LSTLTAASIRARRVLLPAEQDALGRLGTPDRAIRQARPERKI
jgi:hypothetical protein